MANKRKHDSCWVYGLVEEDTDKHEGKTISLYEVYINDQKQPWGACNVDWKQVRKDKKMILDDITCQLKNGIQFYFDKNGPMRKRRVK